MMTVDEKTRWIKEEAINMGFEDVGFARAEHMTPEAQRLQAWLKGGNHGTMAYMANHFDKRTDPTKLVPGAKTVISFVFNYYTDIKPDGEYKMAIYALGRDYHKVLKKKLKELGLKMKNVLGPFSGRIFVDSAPVLERDWARRSGLGWVGKNTLLIHPRKGSYFFLAEYIVDFECAYDSPMPDFCGTCRRCIDACPTQAIAQDGYVMDGSKCISYLTIERKEAIPGKFKGQMANYIFGCDICQEVCPWNRFSKKHDEPEFEPSETMISLTSADWENLTEKEFDNLFHGSPVKRTGYHGLKRNIAFLKDQNKS